MPKVSIIVPVYNVGKFLPKCLDSLVNQTLTDIEIILVNDGSIDNSQAVIDTYAANYPEIIKVYTKKNGGLSDARNFGLKKATGDFIGFVDSDDFVDITMFEKLYNRAIETESDVVVCAHDGVYLNSKNAVKKSKSFPIENTKVFGASIFESPAILEYVKSFAWNKLFKREVIEDFEFPKGQLFEDSAVIYNILSAAKKVEYLNQSLYFYVKGRAGAITNSVNAGIFDVFKSCDSIIAYYKKIGKFEELHEVLESRCIHHITIRFLVFDHKGSLKLKLKFIDKAFSYLDENFPNWRNNKYHLKRRADVLCSHPVSDFQKARESRKLLKRYFINKYISDLPQRIQSKIKRTSKKVSALFTRIYCRLAGVPIIPQSVKNSAKELSKPELRELQLLTVDILKTIAEFCDKHNLRYYLAEGSLLGAVRHGGFIPWDDDMDIAMPREDYEKFIKLWGKDTHDQCRLFCPETYPKYYLPFAKVIFMGKCRFSSLIRAGLRSMNEVKGPGIDIFPLDDVSDLSFELLNRAGKIRKYRNILLTKVFYLKNPKKRKPYRFAATFKSYRALHQKLNSLLKAEHGKQTDYYVNFASAYNVTREIFKKDCFEPAKEVEFEHIKVKIPCKAEEILSRTYGDFMTPPPKNMQVCPHMYIVKK